MATNWTNVLIGAAVIGVVLYVLNPRVFEGFSGGIAGGTGPANNSDTGALKPNESDTTGPIIFGVLAGVIVLILVIWFFFFRNK